MVKMKKKLISLALSCVCLTGCGLLPVEETFQVIPIVEEYEVEGYKQDVVLRGDLFIIEEVTSKYTALKRESLSFSVEGRPIANVYVSKGQQVSAGDLLAELEADNLDERMSDQSYQIQVLKTQISHLKANYALELEMQTIKETAVQEQLSALAARQQQIADRLSQLAQQIQEAEAGAGETQPAPTEETQPATTQLDQLLTEQAALLSEQGALPQQQATLQNSQLVLAQERTGIETAYENQMQAYEDALYIARIRFNAIEQEKKEQQIHAGMDGIVTYVRTILEGTLSTEGQIIVEVTDLDAMSFVVRGDEAAYFPVGTEVVLKCYDAEYTAVSVAAEELGMPEPTEEENVAYLHVAQPDAVFQEGEHGEMEVILEERHNVLYLKKKAVHYADGRHFVYVLNEDGLRVMQDVTVGLETKDAFEIISGLKEGDSVILD